MPALISKNLNTTRLGVQETKILPRLGAGAPKFITSKGMGTRCCVGDQLSAAEKVGKEKYCTLTHIHTHTLMDAHTNVHTQTCAHNTMHTHKCTHVYIQTHMETIHIHKHICKTQVHVHTRTAQANTRKMSQTT